MPHAPAWKGRAAGGGQGTRALVIGSGFIGSHVVAELAAAEPAACRAHPLASARDRSWPRDRSPTTCILGDAGDPAAVEAALWGVDEVFYCAGGLLPAAPGRSGARRRAHAAAAASGARSATCQAGDPPHLHLFRRHRLRRPRGAARAGDGADPPARLLRPPAPCLRAGDRAELRRARPRRAHLPLRDRLRREPASRPRPGGGPTFLHRIEHGQTIDLYGGGETIRDYVYAGDVAAVAVETMAHDDCPRVLNVASGTGTSLLDLSSWPNERWAARQSFERHPERGFDVHAIVLDIGRLQALTGFEPTPLEDGIARTHGGLPRPQRSGCEGSAPPLDGPRLAPASDAPGLELGGHPGHAVAGAGGAAGRPPGSDWTNPCPGTSPTTKPSTSRLGAVPDRRRPRGSSCGSAGSARAGPARPAAPRHRPADRQPASPVSPASSMTADLSELERRRAPRSSVRSRPAPKGERHELPGADDRGPRRTTRTTPRPRRPPATPQRARRRGRQILVYTHQLNLGGAQLYLMDLIRALLEGGRSSRRWSARSTASSARSWKRSASRSTSAARRRWTTSAPTSAGSRS